MLAAKINALSWRSTEFCDQFVTEISAEFVPIKEIDEQHAASVVKGGKRGFGHGESASDITVR